MKGGECSEVMRVVLANRQRQFALEMDELRRLVGYFARAAARRRPCAPWREVTVFFLGDDGISKVNDTIMGHAGSTDVITQRYDHLPGEEPGISGEIFVNVAAAWRGRRPARVGMEWSASHELALYLAHGCDHLSDADDTTPAGRLSMRRRELRWLSAAGVPILLKKTEKNIS